MAKKDTSDRDRGREDARRGRWNPPGGEGFLPEIRRQIQGEEKTRKEYRKGHDEGKPNKGW